MTATTQSHIAGPSAWGGADGSTDEIGRLGREYFTRLDLQTNPVQSAPNRDREAVMFGLREVLKRRLFMRRARADGESIAGTLPGHEPTAIRGIATLIPGLLRSVFGEDLLDPVRLDRIGKVHDRFAWGGLRRPLNPRMRIPNNVPDGAAIFLYPEFAHLVVECSVDECAIERDLWVALLPILTRLPALYLFTHESIERERRRLPRLFDEFGEPPKTALSPEDFERHAEEFAVSLHGLDPEQLGAWLGDIALRAFKNPSCPPPSK